MTRSVLSRTVTVLNPQGLHARPAHALVTAARGFKSDIRVVRNGEAVDGKSILSVLTLAAERGTQLTLRADGEDAEEALETLAALFANEFEANGVGDGNREETSANGSAHNG